ncbi:MAG: hypothetical protein IT460_13530, partial [Planctomycetes bacterium]|nr:hypothetical protein [Planctomycetota bacterium]
MVRPLPKLNVEGSSPFARSRGRNWRTSELRKDPSQSYSDAVTTVQRWKTGHVRYVTDPASKVTETQYDAA